jgi:hypothetical protein
MTTLLLTAALLAADLTGTWIGKLPGNRGAIEDVAFQFTQQGSSLAGKQYGDFESTPILKGTVAGELVMFVLVRQEQAGNEINETRIRFTGRLVGEELELTREREAATRSGSGASVAFRNNARQTFRLRKLI